MLEYALGIAAAMLLAWLVRDRSVTDGVAATTLSWGAWCAFILLTGQYEPWYAGIVFDATAAWWLLRNPTNKMKSVLASIFCIQITMHVAYGLNMAFYGAADWQAYYIRTQVTGWLQLLILGAWAGGNLVMRYVPVRGLVRPSGAKEGS